MLPIVGFAQFATTDTAIAPLIKEEFIYIHVNYSKDNKNPEAMEYLGNPARFGFPVFVILNDEGRPIHIQESASLEEGKGYDRKKVKNFLSLWTKKAVTTHIHSNHTSLPPAKMGLPRFIIPIFILSNHSSTEC